MAATEPLAPPFASGPLVRTARRRSLPRHSCRKPLEALLHGVPHKQLSGAGLLNQHLLGLEYPPATLQKDLS